MSSRQKLVTAISTASAFLLFGTCSYVGHRNLLDCFTDSSVPAHCRGEPFGLSLFPQPSVIPGTSPDIEAIILSEMEPLLSHPEFKRRLAQGARSAETTAEARASGQQFGQQLVARGISRLPLNDLDEWNRLKLAMARSSDELCSAFWTGIQTPELIFSGLSSLPETDLKIWAQLSSRAGILELEAISALPPDSSAIADGLAGIVQVVTEDEGSHLTRTVELGSTAAAVDGCRALKTMMNGAQDLQPELRERFLRAVAGLN